MNFWKIQLRSINTNYLIIVWHYWIETKIIEFWKNIPFKWDLICQNRKNFNFWPTFYPSGEWPLRPPSGGQIGAEGPLSSNPGVGLEICHLYHCIRCMWCTEGGFSSCWMFGYQKCGRTHKIPLLMKLYCVIPILNEEGEWQASHKLKVH